MASGIVTGVSVCNRSARLGYPFWIAVREELSLELVQPTAGRTCFAESFGFLALFSKKKWRREAIGTFDETELSDIQII